MLTEKINLSAYETLYREQQAVDGGETVFSAPLILRKPFLVDKGKTITDYYTPPQTDGTGVLGAPQTITDYYTPQPSDDFAVASQRQLNIPSVLQLETTDKTGTGVYDAQPLRFNPSSIFNQEISSPAPPIDATVLSNDATDGLTTYRVPGASPLGLGYAGGNAFVQGTDPVAPGASADEPAPASTCAWYDFPCKFQSVKGEATILIVGVVLLAIGIFALTK